MAETKATSTGQQERQGTQQETGGGQTGMQPAARRGGQMLRRRDTPDLFAIGPADFMRRMSEEMDRVFEDFGFAPRWSLPRLLGRSEAMRAGVWSPRIEAIQQGDTFIVRAELPGLKKDDIEVNVTDDSITLQGQRQQEQREEREGYFHSERSYGSFYREIPLPEGVIGESAEATFKDGVLEIRLQAPPHEVSRGRRLEIKGEAGKQK